MWACPRYAASEADRVPDGLELEKRLDLPGALGLGRRANDPFDVFSGELLELAGRPVCAGEVDGVHVHVPGEPGRKLVAEAGEEVRCASGAIRGRERLCQLDRGEWMELRGDRDTRVSADERRHE